jgi:hypothetical protein
MCQYISAGCAYISCSYNTYFHLGIKFMFFRWILKAQK